MALLPGRFARAPRDGGRSHLSGLTEKHESLRPTIEQLQAQHRLIDPLLERGDHEFAEPPHAKALAVVVELEKLLDEHLRLEEDNVVPRLRETREFPAPPDEATAVMYAQGFAWSSHGIAQEVLDRVYALLPEGLVARLPAARNEFEKRCLRVWGTIDAGASRTSLPE